MANSYYTRGISTGNVIPQTEFENLEIGFDNVEAAFLQQTVDYTYETQIAVVISAITPGDVYFDLAGPSIFTVTLTEDIDAIGYLNLPVVGLLAKAVIIFTQDATGGRSINFGTTRFCGGTPTIGANPGDSTIITILSYDQGVNIFGISAGVATA